MLLALTFITAVLACALGIVLVLRWVHGDGYDIHDIWADDDDDYL